MRKQSQVSRTQNLKALHEKNDNKDTAEILKSMFHEPKLLSHEQT